MDLAVNAAVPALLDGDLYVLVVLLQAGEEGHVGVVVEHIHCPDLLHSGQVVPGLVSGVSRVEDHVE